MIGYMNVREFVDEGYLFEVNRRVLHPLGLALTVSYDDDHPEEVTLAGIQDDREDPEGWYFDDDDPEILEKADHICSLWTAREPARRAGLGYLIQPIGPTYRDDNVDWKRQYKALVLALDKAVKYDVRKDIYHDAMRIDLQSRHEPDVVT